MQPVVGDDDFYSLSSTYFENEINETKNAFCEENSTPNGTTRPIATSTGTTTTGTKTTGTSTIATLTANTNGDNLFSTNRWVYFINRP